ncbi:MAG TPA: hypothetical protein VHT92_09935 [Candidatus Cybelea sp.]|nr:hypothetical protein [Candidatus Cybelea sp.]
MRLLRSVARADARLLRVVAPAGYGKTTLIHQLGRTFETYSVCDCEGAAGVVELCRRVLAAIAGAAADEVVGLSMQIVSLQDDPAQWSDLAKRVWAASTGRRELFVFDNLEGLAETVACRDLVTQLIALSPVHRAVALCSRVHVGLALPRQVVPHLSIRIEAEDLAFDSDEFYQVFEGTSASAAVLQRIEEIANGWPIAILLLRRMLLEGDSAPAKLLENQVAFADLYDYLSEHVLSTLSEEQMSTLLTCVAVPETTQRDLELALNRDQERVRAIVDTVPFVARSASLLIAHPLIAKTLRERYDADCTELLRRVADGHSAHGALLRAARLYAAAGDKESAAATLERGNWLATSTWPIEFAQIVSQIDDETILRYPAVWTATSIVRACQQTPEEWRAKTYTVWTSVQSDERPHVKAIAFSAYVAALMNLGRLDEAMIMVRTRPPCLDPDDFSVTMSSALCAAAIDAWTGRFGRLREYRAQLEPVIAASAGWHSQYLYEIEARVQRTNGDWPAERRALEHAMDFGRSSNMATIPLWVLTYQVCGSWFAGDNVYCQARVAELESEMYAGIAKAFSFIVDCARGRAAGAASGYERPELRAWGISLRRPVATT